LLDFIILSKQPTEEAIQLTLKLFQAAEALRSIIRDHVTKKKDEKKKKDPKKEAKPKKAKPAVHKIDKDRPTFLSMSCTLSIVHLLCARPSRDDEEVDKLHMKLKEMLKTEGGPPFIQYVMSTTEKLLRNVASELQTVWGVSERTKKFEWISQIAPMFMNQCAEYLAADDDSDVRERKESPSFL
jgi:hypothetical protein